LPSVLGQPTGIVMMVMTVAGEEAAPTHVIDNSLNVLALCCAQSSDDGLLYIHIHIYKFFILRFLAV
jgi:hypothetical protein